MQRRAPMADELHRCCESFDPRRPRPAGHGIDRRKFLLRSAQALGGLITVYGAGRLGLGPGTLSDGVARAASAPPGRVLVSVFVPGGMDALSFLAPVTDPVYHKLRPRLALSESQGIPLTDDPRLHWHPAAKPFADLHAQGKVTGFPGIGYSHPDMSHFTSRHYWEVGALDVGAQTGWMGRYLDLAGQPDNPLQGLSLDGQMSPTIATARNPVAAINRPEDFSLWLPGAWGEVSDLAVSAIGSLGRTLAGGSDTALSAVGAVAAEIDTLQSQLAQFRDPDGNPTYSPPVGYPQGTQDSDFPRLLGGLAAMLAAGLPLRCVSITAPGDFDTHSAQPAAFQAGLDLTARSLGAFQADLEARGLDDRVLIHVWTEFGRRAQENGSTGTDHGAGGVSLLIGTRTTGGLVGEWPGTCGQPSTSARSTARCWSSGSPTTRRRSSLARGGCPATSWCDEALASLVDGRGRWGGRGQREPGGSRRGLGPRADAGHRA
jgi:uncharacterized protein (DUF1501 family)